MRTWICNSLITLALLFTIVIYISHNCCDLEIVELYIQTESALFCLWEIDDFVKKSHICNVYICILKIHKSSLSPRNKQLRIYVIDVQVQCTSYIFSTLKEKFRVCVMDFFLFNYLAHTGIRLQYISHAPAVAGLTRSHSHSCLVLSMTEHMRLAGMLLNTLPVLLKVWEIKSEKLVLAWKKIQNKLREDCSLASHPICSHALCTHRF